MAYISKAEVQAKSAKLKEINKKYGVKATFSGSNSSTLQLTVSSGQIDFISDYCDMIVIRNSCFEPQSIIDNAKKTKYIQINHYYLDTQFSDVTLQYLEEVYALMKEGHYDESDVMTDYFNCSWYNSIHIGRWNKGYELVK
jgi:hypothetical protein